MTTGLPEVGYGILFAIISMICNGSFSSFNKLPSVVKSKVDPQIFNLYFICGCIASCILVYIVLVAMGETVTFTYLGVISGFLLALCGLTTFAAIGHIGLSVGVAIWSGTAIVVSFIEGLLIDSDLYSWPISIVGVVVLVFGIIVVSFSEVVAGCCCFDAMHRHDQSQQNNNVPDSVQNGAGDGSDASVESQTLIDHNENEPNIAEQSDIETFEDSSGTKWFLGIFYAILTGILGGSIGFPSGWTDSNNAGVKYLISFAVGASLVYPLTAVGLMCFRDKNPTDKIEWNFGICFIPGFLAGVVWNGGNLASLYAIQILGYSVAYPIMQSSLIIAAIWGVFVWKEFTNPYVISFIFLGALIVMAGCAAITYGVNG